MSVKSSELNEIINNSSKIEGPFIFSLNKEVLADLETPVSTFYKICENKPYSFLLESVEGGEKLGRYSIIGTEPILLFTNKNNKTTLENKTENEILILNENPFIALKEVLKRFQVINTYENNFLGFVGYFGYETVRWVEPKTLLLSCKDLPDVCLILPSKVIVFDHIFHKVKLLINVYVKNKNEINNKYLEGKENLEKLLIELQKPKALKPLSLKYDNEQTVSFISNYKKEDFLNKIKKAKDYIKDGDIFQVVLSQKLLINGSHNGFLLYRALRSINPSPYLFYINYKDFEIAGSSPESMVKCEFQNGMKKASLRPIAGTYPRGKNEEEDLKNILNLKNDPKEKAEHLMLIDLARNDLGRVCKTASINAPELMIIEKYSHVLHMVSQVEGILKNENTSIDLLHACFPAGTLTGAPKVRAMQIINELEKSQRGPYGGCIGFYSFNDTINTAMTIRTFLIYKDHIEIQVGAGIVADSDPGNEYEETMRKGAALLKAISLLN